MSNNPFAAPGSTSGISWDDHKGRLLIIEPLRIQEGIATNYGTADAVAANIHSLTGPTDAEVYEDVLVFPKVLQGQLRSKIGEKVLGRLGQGVAKAGQSPPWLLEEATADDVAKGVAYLDHLAKKAVSTPEPATAGAASGPADGDVPF